MISVQSAASAESFHLPGKHDQSSHGKRGDTSAGKKVSEPTHTSGMSREDYVKRAKKSSTGRKAFSKTPISGISDLTDAADSDGNVNGVSRHAISDALRGVHGDARHEDTSSALRKSKGDTKSLSAQEQDRVKAIDAGLKSSKLTGDILTHDITVTPETFFGDAWNSDGNNTGLTWVNHGYTSTSAKRDWGTGFENSPNKTEITFLLPKGVEAMGTNWDVKQAMSKNGDGDIIAQRGLKFRIVSDTGKSESLQQTRLIAVEVVE